MILALEFSAPQRSVAVLSRSASGQLVVLGRGRDDADRRRKPMQLIESALAAAKLEPDGVTSLLVGLGPGSYTGVRSAIAIAQGWQLARGVPVAAVSSADALAAQAWANGCVGPVAIVIDAQRQEFYLASFNLSAQSIKPVDSLRLVTGAEVKARVQALGALVVGPDVLRWFPDARALQPEAESLAAVLPADGGMVPAEKLEPIYLREVSFVKAPPPTRGSAAGAQTGTG